MSPFVSLLERHSWHKSQNGMRGAPSAFMFVTLRATLLLFLFSLVVGWSPYASANGLIVRDERTRVVIMAPSAITDASLYAELSYPPNIQGPDSRMIPLKKASPGISEEVKSGETFLPLFWGKTTLEIRKSLVPATGQYVLPIRGDIATVMGLPSTASGWVVGCSITYGGETFKCPLLTYEPPRFSVYNHYIESGTIRPLVSGSSLWRTDAVNKSTPKPVINAYVKTGTYAAALVVKGTEDVVKKIITDYTGRSNPAPPPSVLENGAIYFGTRGIVNRRTRTNVLTPAQFQYSGFDYAVKRTFGSAVNNQWAYVKGMALYDGVTVVPITDYEKFDTSLMKSPPGYPGVYTTWGLPVPFGPVTLAFEDRIPESFFVKSGLVTYSVVNAYSE